MTDDTKKPAHPPTPSFETSTGARTSKPTPMHRSSDASSAPASEVAPHSSATSDPKKGRGGLAGAVGGLTGAAALAGAGTAAAQFTGASESEARSTEGVGHSADVKGAHDAMGAGASKGIGAGHDTSGAFANDEVAAAGDAAAEAAASPVRHHAKGAIGDDAQLDDGHGEETNVDEPDDEVATGVEPLPAGPIIDVNMSVNVVVDSVVDEKPQPVAEATASAVIDDKPPLPAEVAPPALVAVEPTVAIEPNPNSEPSVDPTVALEPAHSAEPTVDPALADAPIPNVELAPSLEPTVGRPENAAFEDVRSPDPTDPALSELDPASLDTDVALSRPEGQIELDVRIDAEGRVVAQAHASGDAPPVVLHVEDASGASATLHMDSDSRDGDVRGQIVLDNGDADVSGIVTGESAVIAADLMSATGDSAAVLASGESADLAITANETAIAADGFAEGQGADVQMQARSAEGDAFEAISGTDEGSATINATLGVDGVDARLEAEGVGTFGGGAAYDTGDEPLEPALEVDTSHDDEGLDTSSEEEPLEPETLEPASDPLAMELAGEDSVAAEPPAELEPDALEPISDPGVQGEMLEPGDHMEEQQEGLGERDFSDYADAAPDDLDS